MRALLALFVIAFPLQAWAQCTVPLQRVQITSPVQQFDLTEISEDYDNYQVMFHGVQFGDNRARAIVRVKVNGQWLNSQGDYDALAVATYYDQGVIFQPRIAFNDGANISFMHHTRNQTNDPASGILTFFGVHDTIHKVVDTLNLHVNPDNPQPGHTRRETEQVIVKKTGPIEAIRFLAISPNYTHQAQVFSTFERGTFDLYGCVKPAVVIPPPPPPPPEGTYRCLRFHVTKIVDPDISFRLVDLGWGEGEATAPSMTSNTTPSPSVASASSEAGADQAWKGMDGSITSIWNSTQVSDQNGNVSAWIQIDLGEGNGMDPDQFTYWPTNSGGDRTAVDFTLKGSETCVFSGEEVTLKSVTGETSKPHSQPVNYSIP